MTPLTVAVVGLRGMGLSHAKAFAACPDFRVVAGCDLDPARTAEFAAALPGAAVFADFTRMLAEVRSAVVVIATGTASHAALALAAGEAGARGVFCEKPMAVNLGDARAMVAACRARGCALAVNHQRRTQPPYTTMRRLMIAGAIGKVELIRGSCAGDLLSDGTHAIDSIRWLTGDAPVRRVRGQVGRDRPNPAEPRGGGYDGSGGWRYGHPIESGAQAILEFDEGLRAELFTGRFQPRGRGYQDIEVFGTGGRLWRAGDQAGEPLLIQDAPHPLAGDSALADQEVVMAVHESARLRRRVDLPLAQDRYPLELLIEAGEL